MTRILVFLGAAAGMLYNALWYFPVLMFLAGVAAVVHDLRWLHKPVLALATEATAARRRFRQAEDGITDLPAPLADSTAGLHAAPGVAQTTLPLTEHGQPSSEQEPRVVSPELRLNFSWKFGLGIITCFLVTFVVIMVLRGTLPSKSLLFSFFADMCPRMEKW
ncbi:hypothetical protein HIM_06371 [Hirsutella minnesotensis 3608]|uniref:Uncharacterized protein n=1 Tax=Hirsutella minnesotensis 3608 TaxID=1043627 RepID=A0A0F7ZNQ1_9HYPO|nr:hypothetical protein HIM_06371 [Hirsutella minnesotensis 3608]